MASHSPPAAPAPRPRRSSRARLTYLVIQLAPWLSQLLLLLALLHLSALFLLPLHLASPSSPTTTTTTPPPPSLAKKTYVDEHALVPGTAACKWRNEDVHVLDSLANDIRTWHQRFNSLDEANAAGGGGGGGRNETEHDDEQQDERAAQWSLERAHRLQKLLTEQGLQAHVQPYTFNTTTGRRKKIKGANTYAVLRAPRADGAESLVLHASWRSRSAAAAPHHPHHALPLVGATLHALDDRAPRISSIHSESESVNTYGIASVLALANYFSKQSYWSKDIVLLISDGFTEGAHAWLDAFHGASQPSASAISTCAQLAPSSRGWKRVSQISTRRH